MTDHSHGPWAHPPRKRSPRYGTAWLFAVAVSLILAAAALVDNLDAQPWVETFAPAHPDHPRGY